MCKGISGWMKEDEAQAQEVSSLLSQQEKKPENAEQVRTLMKSFQELQQENKKLEGQIYLLNTAKEKLEHAHAKLALPSNPLPTSPELPEDTLPPHPSQSSVDSLQPFHPWVVQAPSAPPPPYVFPIMSLEGGEIRGPQGQQGAVIGGFADVVHITPAAAAGQQPSAQPRAVQPMGMGEAASAKAGPSTSSPKSVDFMEFDPLKTQGEPGAEDHLTVNLATSQEKLKKGISVTPSTGGTASPADEVRRLEFTPLPTPARKEHSQPVKTAGMEKPQWIGEVYGEVQADKDALAEILQRVIKVEERVKKENLAVFDEEDEIEEENEPDCVEGCEARPDTKMAGMKLRSQKTVYRTEKPKQKLVSQDKTIPGREKRQSMFRKYNLLKPEEKEVHFKNSLDNLEWEMPLMCGAKQEPVYRSYKMRDLEALVQQLPPITEGGAAWLRKLRTLTEGDELCLGDFRAVAGRTMIAGGLADVEEIAKTTTLPNDVPYSRVEDKLADAVREKYITPNVGSIPKITWDPKDTPREFLEKAKEQWMSQTGIHPGQEGENRAWFRAAVLKGLPEKVTTDLEKNPDFAVADSTQWERHVTHRLQLEQDTVNKQKKELEEAQAQLLKLQLGEAREKNNVRKKEKEGIKPMMVVQPQVDPAPEQPERAPSSYPGDHEIPRQRRTGRNRGANRLQRGRGGLWRPDPRARGPGNPRTNSWNVCYQCGREGHWARECRELPRSYEQRDYQAWGTQRGRGGYQDRHQAPNPSVAPRSQYPVGDWSWEEQY
ncbi:hemicentin [Sarotherodon galilaeus]